jgi:hypothetical protein
VHEADQEEGQRAPKQQRYAQQQHEDLSDGPPFAGVRQLWARYVHHVHVGLRDVKQATPVSRSPLRLHQIDKVEKTSFSIYGTKHCDKSRIPMPDKAKPPFTAPAKSPVEVGLFLLQCSIAQAP